MNVLLVESDNRTADAVVAVLRRQGYRVQRAATAAEALAAPAVDLVLLSLGLPEDDGIEVCRALRHRGNVAIIAVITPGDDRAAALRSGADDFVVKPYSLTELSARIDATMRRRQRPDPVVSLGGLRIDLATNQVTLAEERVALTDEEFELLACLAREPGAVVAPERLLIEVGPATWRKAGSSLDTHLATLGSKLGQSAVIQTVHDVGYRLAVGGTLAPGQQQTDQHHGLATVGPDATSAAQPFDELLADSSLGTTATRALQERGRSLRGRIAEPLHVEEMLEASSLGTDGASALQQPAARVRTGAHRELRPDPDRAYHPADWNRVFSVDTDVPRGTTLHRAHRLGVRFALLARLESRPPSGKRDQTIQSYRSACKYLCNYLAVPFPSASAANENRVEILSSRIDDVHQLEVRIAQSFGADIAAAFRLGFDVALAPEMIPFLPPDQRTDGIRRIATHAANAGRSAEIVKRVTTVLSTAPDTSAMLTGVLDLNDEISRSWFERQGLEDSWLRWVYSTIWRLTRNAALAAIMLSHGAHPQIVNSLFERAYRVADDLDITLPPLFEPTGEQATDSAMALHYLLDELAEPLAPCFSDRYGPGSLDILRLCTRLWALPVVYHPEDDLGQTIGSVLEQVCRALGIPRDTDHGLVDAIRSRSDSGKIKDLVFKFDHAVTDLLASSG